MLPPSYAKRRRMKTDAAANVIALKVPKLELDRLWDWTFGFVRPAREIRQSVSADRAARPDSEYQQRCAAVGTDLLCWADVSFHASLQTQ